KIFEKLELLDPLRHREENIDDLMIKFHTSQNIKLTLENFKDYNPDNFIKRIIASDDESKFSLIKYLIREIKMLKPLKDDCYNDFIKNLYFFNSNRVAETKVLYIKVKKGIHHWNGENKGDDKINIFVGKRQLKYRINQKIEIKPEPIKEDYILGELNKFLPFIKLRYKIKNEFIEIELDYFLYELLMKINEGYQLNKKDRNDFVKFENIVKKISLYGNKENELEVVDKVKKIKFRIKIDEFGDFVYAE
ncbi:MAG: DNA phosphorothioation-dependent restriction protein DptF, partial [Fusobacteriaceae bacterium]|nr:DNA phosphorothioation-dependent restriction protein DptF [Fusobacteriaceae bacterium]